MACRVADLEMGLKSKMGKVKKYMRDGSVGMVDVVYNVIEENRRKAAEDQ